MVVISTTFTESSPGVAPSWSPSSLLLHTTDGSSMEVQLALMAAIQPTFRPRLSWFSSLASSLALTLHLLAHTTDILKF